MIPNPATGALLSRSNTPPLAQKELTDEMGNRISHFRAGETKNTYTTHNLKIKHVRIGSLD